MPILKPWVMKEDATDDIIKNNWQIKQIKETLEYSKQLNDEK